MATRTESDSGAGTTRTATTRTPTVAVPPQTAPVAAPVRTAPARVAVPPPSMQTVPAAIGGGYVNQIPTVNAAPGTGTPIFPNVPADAVGSVGQIMDAGAVLPPYTGESTYGAGLTFAPDATTPAATTPAAPKPGGASFLAILGALAYSLFR